MAKKYVFKSPGGSKSDKYEGPAPAGGKTVWVEREGKWGKGIGHNREEAEDAARDDWYDEDED